MPRTRTVPALAFVVALATALAGCGGPDAASPGQLSIVKGSGQRGDADELAPLPMLVRVIGRDGNVAPGVPVKFEVIEGPGSSLTEGLVQTDSNGLAQTFLRFGVLPVRHRVRASVTGSEVVFEAFAENLTPPVPIQFSSGFLLPEGIAFDNRGGLYVGTQVFGQIWRLDPSFTKTTFSQNDGQNFLGLAFDRAGNLYACEQQGGVVLRITPFGEQQPFIEQFDFRPLAMPNGIAVHPGNGDVYFSTSDDNRIWRVPPTARPLTIFAEDVGGANGLAFSADGRTLYAASLSGNAVVAFDLDADGNALARRRVAQIPVPDGIALDTAGNLFVTGTAVGVGGNALWIVPADGSAAKPLVPAPVGRLYANIAFGREGFDTRTLYLVSFDGALDAVYLGTEGLPLPAPVAIPRS